MTDEEVTHDKTTITVIYQPRYADPNPDGGYDFTGTISNVDRLGFDFTDLRTGECWSIMDAELRHGDVRYADGNSEMAVAMSHPLDPTTDEGYGARAVND